MRSMVHQDILTLMGTTVLSVRAIRGDIEEYPHVRLQIKQKGETHTVRWMSALVEQGAVTSPRPTQRAAFTSNI